MQKEESGKSEIQSEAKQREERYEKWKDSINAPVERKWSKGSNLDSCVMAYMQEKTSG